MKKSLKIIIPIVITALIIGGVFGYITYHDNSIYKSMQEQITASDKIVELQSGELEISVKDIVDVSDLDCTVLFENGSDKITVNTGTVGEQTVKVIAAANNTLLFDKAIELDAKIIVTDTTPPEFTESIDEIRITEGEELDIISKFSAEDLSGEVDIELEGDFDKDKVGEQTVTVIAKDINGNTSEKEVKISVEAKPVEKTASSSSTASKSGNSSSSSSNKSSTSSSSGGTTTASAPYWCTEGGSHHVINVGTIGWYSSYASAESAAKAYINANDNVRGYEVQECDCGLFTAQFTFF